MTPFPVDIKPGHKIHKLEKGGIDDPEVEDLSIPDAILQLEQARLLCCKFLERELHLSNCLGMMSYAWHLGCSQLYRAARQVALTHFSALITDEDFMLGRSLPRTRGRETLFVLGGPHDQDTQALYQFHPLTGRWQSCAPLERKNLTQYSMAAVGDSVVVTGGYFRDVLWFSVDWVLIYNSGSQRWTEGPALQKSRHSHCSVGLGDLLFVMGGSMDECLVNDVERLDLGSGGWVSVSPMIRAVERAAAAALGSNIYVACGLDENGEAYGGVQRYVVEHDQWDVVSYSPYPRYDLVATELNGALYLFGGYSLRFDVDTDEWTLLEEDCLEKKFFSGCTTVLGQIYLVSEKKGNKGVPNMVLLDPYIDTCLEVDNAIPCSVPIRGSVTMKMSSLRL
uniref:BACK domain-containing protein n=1 Tax=Knipowitschia caucasica TaxID=637954 RepID=A0AAV2KUA8_KNICA